jgi:hypothetical protein
VGHTCIFTGSVPSIHGIAGNDWTNQLTGKRVYCTDDSTVHTVGAPVSADGRMSPRNLLVSTVTDELRIATNFQSRVVGISLKDRAAILKILTGSSATAGKHYTRLKATPKVIRIMNPMRESSAVNLRRFFPTISNRLMQEIMAHSAARLLVIPLPWILPGLRWMDTGWARARQRIF